MNYGHSDIAAGISAKLRVGDSAFTDIGVAYISPSTSSSEFTVTMDDGQRFKVIVQKA